MKKFLFLAVVLFAGLTASATQYTIVTEGQTYSPNLLNAQVGDTINFEISANHPTVQVSLATFLINGTTELDGGFGLHDSNFSIVLTEDDVPGISYVCVNHVANGMKGGIVVASTVAVAEITPEVVDFTYGPNPIENNQFNFNSNIQIAKFEIYSLTGQLVKAITVDTKEGNVVLDLKQGIYLMNILDEKGNSFGVRKLSVK